MPLLLARAHVARSLLHSVYIVSSAPVLLSLQSRPPSRAASTSNSTSPLGPSPSASSPPHPSAPQFKLPGFRRIAPSTGGPRDEDPWKWAQPSPSGDSSPPEDGSSPSPPPGEGASSSKTPDVPPVDHDDSLRKIEHALQTSNPLALARLLLGLSGHPSHPVSDILLRLPSTAFSALLHMLDPVRHGAEIDPAYGIHIPAGLSQYSRVASLNNCYGVRHVYLALFPVLMAAFRARLRNRRAVVADDYQVLLRCAGACQDVHAVRTVWKLMDVVGHVSWRNTELFTEFIQARFLTLPLYYQFDRARVRLRPGDLYRSTTALPAAVRLRLNRLRVSLNLHRWQQHGVMERGPDHNDAEDGEAEKVQDLAVSRLLRAQGPVNRVWIHALKYGAIVDEKLFCAVLIAWSRTGARRRMKVMLRRHYGIRILENWEVRGFKVVMSEAFYFKDDSPRRPTKALIHAVVDAFSTTGDVRIAVALATAISERWNIPMTHDIWSSILRWAYISGAKPFSTEWKIVRSAKPQWRGGPLEASQIKFIWDAMTTSSEVVEPTWDDFNFYVRSLINSNDLGLALDSMLDARKRYEAMIEETTWAFHALQEHAHAMGECAAVERLHLRWQRCRFRLDLARNDIRLWVEMWLKKHSRQAMARESTHETSRLVPRMALAFKEWLPFPLKYRTATGHVRLFVQGDPTLALEQTGIKVLEEARQSISLLEAEGKNTRRVEHATNFADAFSEISKAHRAEKPPGRTLEPGQDVPLLKTIFFKPPPTSMRQTANGRAETPGKGRKVSKMVQPWIRRTTRTPWISPPAVAEVDSKYQPVAERRKGRMWLEPVFSGDVEEDLALKPREWVREQRGLS